MYSVLFLLAPTFFKAFRPVKVAILLRNILRIGLWLIFQAVCVAGERKEGTPGRFTPKKVSQSGERGRKCVKKAAERGAGQGARKNNRLDLLQVITKSNTSHAGVGCVECPEP